MRINHSDGYPNWSQLKNFDEPYSTCNVTSAINAAQCCGFDTEKLRRSPDPNKRPADDLYEFIHSDERVQKYYTKITDKKYPPNQYMEVLSFALGLWLNSPNSVEWHYGLPLELIVDHVVAGGCGILHGHYPTQNKDIDHMNALVGVEYDASYDKNGKSIKELTAFIIDDPYGDYRKLYAEHMGNDIKMPIDDILKYIKDTSDKHNKDIILIHRSES